jgi:DNA-binding PadR family transcriptional regulator
MLHSGEHHNHLPPFFGGGHRRFHGHGMRFGLGNRARRGDIQIAVLALLNESAMHGYQIIQELAERSGGAWTPSAGSVYPTLQLLEDQGQVVSEQVAGKRVFSLTEEGKARADALPDKEPWAGLAGEADSERGLREAFMSLVGATTQVARAGSPEQIARAVGVLTEARRQMYVMLAGDE